MGIKSKLFILLLLCSGIISAQNLDFKFRNFSIKEGLSQSSVFSIYQDKKGFLWIATSDGLNQFDGYKFTVYKNNHLDSNSLSDSWVAAILLEDSDNELWLYTADRTINRLNLRTKEIKRLTHNKSDSAALRFEQLYYIYEDSHKNVWLSTDLGICRYNRKEQCTTEYFKDKNSPSSITGNFVTYILEDHHGFIWFSTFKGLYRYNIKSKSFDSFRHKPESDNNLLSDKIFWLGEDKNQTFWVLTSKGLCKFNYKSQTFDSYPFPVTNEITDFKSTFLSTKVSKDNYIWIGTDFGLFRFDITWEQYFHYQNNKLKPNSISANKISFIYEDKHENIWVGTSDGLNKYNQQTNSFERGIWPKNYSDNHFISNIFEDKKGEIWILGTIDPSRGALLGHLNPETKEIEIITSDKCNPNSISSSYVYSPFSDKNGNIWLASFGDGLIQYVPRNSKFENYSFVQGNANSPGGNSIWGFAEDNKGNIWIPLFNKGVDKFNPKTKQFSHFTFQNKKLNGTYSIFNITKGKNNDMWFSTVNGGILYLNTQTEKFKQYLNQPNKSNSLSSNFMRKILVDPSGKLWVGHASAGLDFFDPVTETAINYKHNSSDKNSLSNNNIWCILQDKNNELWISTDGYVDRFNPVTKKFIHYKSKSSNGINADKAICMYEDTRGTIWFGTSGGGLSSFNRVTGKFRHWTETEGLPNNVIYGILEDDKGCLWLSTNKGLSRFDITLNKFTNFDASNDLQSNEFNMGSCFKSSDNKLYFGGINGFNAFYPTNIVPDTAELNTIITGFQIFNKDITVVPPAKKKLIDPARPSKIIRDHNTLYLAEDISYSGDIVLSYREKVFTIEFAALFFDSPEKVTYRYMMENFDTDWNYSGTRRFATYTNLPAGDYIFKITAANPDGIWNPIPTELKIKILPPFWRTWWFFALEIFFAVCIIMLIIRLRVMNLKRAKKHLEEKVQERTKEISEKNEQLELRNIQIYKQNEEIAVQAQQLKTTLVMQNQMSEMALLRSQINPHFLFNTLNNIYSLVYQKSEEAPEAVMRLSEIMRYMLYEATSDKVLLQNEINYLRSFIELQLLRIKNRDFVSFVITGNVVGRLISPMLLISFVENAFKHGTKKGLIPGIKINLDVTDNKINFEIINYCHRNKPVNKDTTGGIGLTNVKRRLELLYHNKFVLDIYQDEEIYHVKLELEE